VGDAAGLQMRGFILLISLKHDVGSFMINADNP
jgi:hypothetical protein